MGRKKKYNAKTLKEAVQGYFDSITYEKPLMLSLPTDDLTDQGEPKMKLQQVKTKDGADAVEQCWVEPPSIGKLCLRLGTSKETWSEYSADEMLGPVTAWAKAIVEAQYVARLVEGGRGQQGLMFVLKQNFGWSDKVEVGFDGPTRKAVAAASLTTEEKEEILRGIAMEFAEGARSIEHADLHSGEGDGAGAQIDTD